MEAPAAITVGSIEIEDSGEECVNNPLVETKVMVEIVNNNDKGHQYYIEDFFGSGSSNLFQQLDRTVGDGVLRWTTLQEIKKMLSDFTPKVIDYVTETKPKKISLVVPVRNPELESFEVYYNSDEDDEDMDVSNPELESFEVYYNDDDDDDDDDMVEDDETEYEELNDTNDTNQPTVIKPASKASVESLEKVKLDEACPVGSTKKCSICFDAMEVDSAAAKMPCFHIFHHDCLVQWLKVNNTCPLCRFAMPTDK